MRQANLDAVLDALQRRLVLSASGVLLHVHRRHRLDVLELSVASDWGKFDCGVRAGGHDARIHDRLVKYALRTIVWTHRRDLSAILHRSRRADRAMADSVLALSAEDTCPDLRECEHDSPLVSARPDRVQPRRGGRA